MADLASGNIQSIRASRNFRVLVTEFENGAEQRRKKAQGAIQGFEVTTRPLTQSEYAALETFYDSVGGELAPFTWDHPTSGTTYAVRFDGALESDQQARANGRRAVTYRLKVVS